MLVYGQLCCDSMFFLKLVLLLCFAGAEVKVGEPLLVSPGEEKILHLSQVSFVLICWSVLKKSVGQ